MEYRLHFEGLLSAFARPEPPGLRNKVKFSIRPMTSYTAGQYTCFYRTGELWSEPSDPLNLVITGKCPLLEPESLLLGLNPGGHRHLLIYLSF